MCAYHGQLPLTSLMRRKILWVQSKKAQVSKAVGRRLQSQVALLQHSVGKRFTLPVVLLQTSPERGTLCFVSFRCYIVRQACKCFRKLLFLPLRAKVGDISWGLDQLPKGGIIMKRKYLYRRVRWCSEVDEDVGLQQLYESWSDSLSLSIFKWYDLWLVRSLFSTDCKDNRLICAH